MNFDRSFYCLYQINGNKKASVKRLFLAFYFEYNGAGPVLPIDFVPSAFTNVPEEEISTRRLGAKQSFSA